MDTSTCMTQPPREERAAVRDHYDDGARAEPLSRLRARLFEKHAELTRSERRIAAWLERRFERLAFLTVSEIGRETGVSEATIVRFARKVGFASFTELQRAVQAAMEQRYAGVEAAPDPVAGGGPLQRAYQRDVENLRLTYANVDPRAFEAAVKATARAPMVAVLGLRASAGAAMYASFALNVVRPRVVLIRAEVMHDQLIDMGPGDVLVAFGCSKPDTQALEVVREARRRYGATVVAFTPSAVSDLAREADHVLVVGGDGALDGTASTLSLVGALVEAVAEALREAAASRMRRLDELSSRVAQGA